MKVTGGGIFALGVVVLAFLMIRRNRRQRRRRASRVAIYRSYNEAAADPEFVAEMRAVEADFDCTVADGLEDGDSERRLRAVRAGPLPEEQLRGLQEMAETTDALGLGY